MIRLSILDHYQLLIADNLLLFFFVFPPGLYYRVEFTGAMLSDISFSFLDLLMLHVIRYLYIDIDTNFMRTDSVSICDANEPVLLLYNEQSGQAV